MDKKININDINYEIIENYREAIDLDVLKEALTDYFYDYTYIVGDWSYNKLRLKGFYDSNDKRCNHYNNVLNVKYYVENNCAYGCKWFEIKKINKD
jgi:uncharacterized protein YutD